MPQIDMNLFKLEIAELTLSIKKAQLAGHGKIEKLNDNLIDRVKKLVLAEKEAMRTFFFTNENNIFCEVINGFIYLCDEHRYTHDKIRDELIEKNIENLSALLFYLIKAYEENAREHLTEKNIKCLLNGITLLAKNRTNTALLIFLFEKMRATLSIIDIEQLSLCIFYSNAGLSFFSHLIDQLNKLKSDQKIFELLLSLLNAIVSRYVHENQGVLKKYTLSTTILSGVISILQPTAFAPKNTGNITALIQFILSLSKIRASLPYPKERKKALEENDQDCALLLITIASAMIKKNLNVKDIKIISDYTAYHLDYCKTQPTFIKNLSIRNNLFITATTSLSNALKGGNVEYIDIALQLLTKLTNLFSGTAIFNAIIKQPMPKIHYLSEYHPFFFNEETKLSDVNCFTQLFSLTRSAEAKNNISFLTYVFNTLLNKLDEADQHAKEITLAIFKESRKDYEDALQFYLSQLNPEKLKSILNGEKLITKIIDIKPLLSKKSDLRNLANELHQYQEAGLYHAKNELCNALTIEIKRLRHKRNLNDTDIELSNIFVRIKCDLKKDVDLFRASELEIALNVEMGQVEQILSQKNLDTETVALLSKIKITKSWYVTEYQKEEKAFFDEVLLIASAPSIAATSDVKKEKTNDDAPAAAAKSIASPPIAMMYPVRQQRSAIETNFFHTHHALPPKIAAIAALSIPSVNPAIAALEVPNGPIKRNDDIIDELFDSMRYKI